MTFEITCLVFGVLLISFALAYAWWVKVRVIRLREDLFEIRDQLFDKALALRGLGDCAYCQTRDHINALIRMAGTISVPTVLYTIGLPAHSRTEAKSANAELQRAIEHAMDMTVHRIAAYLTHETLAGSAMWLVAAILPRPVAEREARWGTSKYIDSDVAEQLPRSVGTT